MNFAYRYQMLILIIMSLTTLASSQLEITEVMYAPLDDHEWLEIYNPSDQTWNLTGWEITDNKNTDQLICCSENPDCFLIIEAKQYLIVTDQSSIDFRKANPHLDSLCVDDNSVGNGLSNQGDSLKLHKEGYSFSMSYTGELGANKNGKTLEREQEQWRESYWKGGTPGTKSSQLSPEIVDSEEQVTSNRTEEMLSEEKARSVVVANTEAQSEVKDLQKSPPRLEIYRWTKNIKAGDALSLEFLINSGSETHDFSVWAYLYRSNKCYSCGDNSREENLQRVSLKADEEKIINFRLALPQQMESGEYFLKVRVLKDQQKTSQDFKEKILVEGSLSENEEESPLGRSEKKAPDLPFKKPSEKPISGSSLAESQSELEIQEVLARKKALSLNAGGEFTLLSEQTVGETVYSSKNDRMKKIVPYVLVTVFSLLAVILVLKR